MRVSNHPLFSILFALLLLSPSSLAFDTPLSDQAVRGAYFLGQRRDESMATFLNKYTRFLEPPKTGPHIVSVTFFTPFAVLVQQSSQHNAGYSAQTCFRRRVIPSPSTSTSTTSADRCGTYTPLEGERASLARVSPSPSMNQITWGFQGKEPSSREAY